MLAILLMIDAIAENEEERVFLEQTFDKYSRLMFSVAYKYGLQRQDAEDVVMDSVLSIHKNMTKIRALNVEKMQVYIVSIVRNASLDFLRREKRRGMVFQNTEDDEMEQIASEESVEEKISLQDEIKLVMKAIHELPESERQVMYMKYSRNMENEDIASSTGLSPESIRKYLSRGRNHVRKALLGKEAMANERESANLR